MTDQAKVSITEVDLFHFERQWNEVINGEWVELDIYEKGLKERQIISELAKILNAHVQSKHMGEVVANARMPTIYILLMAENSIQVGRIPDLAFSRGQIRPPNDVWLPYRYHAPTLATLIAVPQETTATRLRRAADFLRYGAEEVWIIYPMKRELHRCQQGEAAPEIYTAGQSLQTPLFPGFELKIADLFVVEET